VSSGTETRRDALRRAALRALRAPSVHNTQPWRFVVTATALEIHADRSRQLGVLDPRGRQLLISLGCAIQHARVAVECAGYEPAVHRFPDEHDLDLVARIELGEPKCHPESAALDRAIDDRRTNRRAYLSEPLPGPFVRELQWLANQEDVDVIAVERPEHRAAIVRTSARAEQIERADPAYVDELNRWISDDARRPDGIQAASVPYAGEHTWTNAPVNTTARGFDVRGIGWLPPSASIGAESLLLFCSAADLPYGWVRVGEALERVWLTLTDRGYWANPLTQLIEVRSTREELVTELELSAQPQLLLRVGKAPAVSPTNRRAPTDVITEPGGA
jgi:nitroreductase